MAEMKQPAILLFIEAIPSAAGGFFCASTCAMEACSCSANGATAAGDGAYFDSGIVSGCFTG
jgi:hypothetical protein